MPLAQEPTLLMITRHALLGVCVLVITGLLVGGCERQSDVDKNDLRSLTRRMHQALLEGDEEAFVRCFGRAADRPAAETLYRTTLAVWAFEQAFIKVYGQDVWATYETAAVLQPRTPSRDPDWVEQVDIELEGNGKAFVIGRFDGEVHLRLLAIKADEQWTFSWGMSPEQAAPGLAVMAAYGQIFSAAAEKIERDKPSLTVVSFFLALRGLMLEGMFARTPRELIETLHLASLARDRQTFIACFARPIDQPIAAAMFDLTDAAWSFQDTYTLAYGAEAWSWYATAGPVRGAAPPLDLAWSSEVPIVAEDDTTATIAVPDGPTYTAARQGDRWSFVVAKPGTSVAEAARQAEADSVLASLFRAGRAKIEREHPPEAVLNIYMALQGRLARGNTNRSPRELLETMHLALLARDPGAFIACFQNPDDRPLAVATYRAVQAAWRFQGAYQNAYGPERWQEYVASPDAIRLNVPPMDVNWSREAPMEAEGEHLARVIDHEHGGVLVMVGRDELWSFVLGVSPEHAAQERNRLDQLAGTFNAAAERLETDPPDPEDVPSLFAGQPGVDMQ